MSLVGPVSSHGVRVDAPDMRPGVLGQEVGGWATSPRKLEQPCTCLRGPMGRGLWEGRQMGRPWAFTVSCGQREVTPSCDPPRLP